MVGLRPLRPLPPLNSPSPQGRQFAYQLKAKRPKGRCLIKYAAGVKLIGQPLVNRVSRILADFPEIRVIVVEVNQGGELWRETFKDLVCADGTPVKIILHTSKEDKDDRFAAGLDFWQKGYVTHRERFDMLTGQAVAYPRGQYDDVIDAAVQGVLWWLAPDRRVRVRARETSYLRVVA